MNWVPSFSGDQLMQAALLLSVPAILILVTLFATGREKGAVMFGVLLMIVILVGIAKLRG